MSANEEPSKLKQYWQRRLLYNGPMITDLCKQPQRFLIYYYLSYVTTPPIIQWLKHSSNYGNTSTQQLTNDTILSFIANSLGKYIVYSVKTVYKYLCPSSIKVYILNPFEWTSHHYQISYLLIGSMGVIASFIHSYLYFRTALNDRLQWPYVYEYMMNKPFTKCLRDLLAQSPLDDNFHIDLTLKLFPIIKYTYFDQYQLSKSYQLKIVQFTAANVAWYCTKWSKVSVQSRYHRIVGVFLCDYDMNQDDTQRKINKKEIRETIVKIKESRLNELNIYNKLNWCKNMAMTLQTHFSGDWMVIIGHRARYRSFHSVILQSMVDNMENSYEHSNIQKVPLQINNKTDAAFIHFGLGPKWYNWSVIVARIE